MTYLTPPEIAQRLRVRRDTVYGWIRAGKLRAVNVSEGTRPNWRVDERDLERFLESRTTTPVRRNPNVIQFY
ncbi:MAG: helix-turn-helix domain-containing protein [Planctomycetota bacterium]|jgi:excisionase family DNA binding protein